jgi:hypothetical protein
MRKSKSQYVELLELRKAALGKGREQVAAQLLAAAEKLVAVGLVSEEERRAAARI